MTTAARSATRPPTVFSHQELSLLRFALGSRQSPPPPDPSSCEEACPIVDGVEQLLCGGEIAPDHQLIHHLNNHIREGLVECGMFELMAETEAGSGQYAPTSDSTRVQQVNRRLGEWECEMNLKQGERELLLSAIKRLPRSAWLSMPQLLWRLRRKLRT